MIKLKNDSIFVLQQIDITLNTEITLYYSTFKKAYKVMKDYAKMEQLKLGEPRHRQNTWTYETNDKDIIFVIKEEGIDN